MFANNISNINDYSRVITYVNIRLLAFCFSLRKDIYNHRDILLVFLFNNNEVFFLINIYSDLLQSALKYFKNTEVNVHNVLIITDDFNIRDSRWNSHFLYYSIFSDLLFDITDSLSLGLSVSTNCVSTRYLDNSQGLNLVINLMFLRYRSKELDHHSIHPSWHLSSDHAPLTITIPIIEKYVQNKKQSIIKGSKKEKSFINDLIKEIKAIDTNNLTNVESLEKVINLLANTIEEI